MRTAGRRVAGPVRVAGVAVALAVLTAACGFLGAQQSAILSPAGAPMPEIGGPVVVGPGPAVGADGVPNAPDDPSAIQPIVKVAEGFGPRGVYRAWVYGTNQGMTCLAMADAGGSTAGCGQGADGIVGASWSNDPTTGVTIVGATRASAATTARVQVRGGGRQDYALVRPGLVVPPDTAVYVIQLPVGVVPERLDILDVTGTVLESTELGFTR